MDAKKRLAMARRLMEVRKSQHLLSQWQVVDSNRAAEAATRHSEAVAEALNREEVTAGAYAEVLRSQSRRSYVHLARSKQVQSDRETDLRHMSQKVEQSKLRMERYDTIVHVETERSALDDLVDQIARRPKSSLDPA